MDKLLMFLTNVKKISSQSKCQSKFHNIFDKINFYISNFLFRKLSTENVLFCVFEPFH